MGGNAVQNVVRINQENVEATLATIYDELLPLIGVKSEDTQILGSAGKKLPGGSSGDIDIAIDMHKLHREYEKGELLQHLADCAEQLGLQTRIFPGLNQVSISYPITNADGKQEGQSVQVDLMPVGDLKYVSWGSYAAHEKDSPYKAAVRQAFLGEVAKNIGYEVLERGEDNRPITWRRGYFHPLQGLFYMVQTYKSPRTGKITKTKSTVKSIFVTSNIDKIAGLLFGAGTKAEDIRTIDDAWKLFLSDTFPYPEKRVQIVKNITQEYQKRGFAYPSYMDQYLQYNTALQLTEATELSTPRRSMLKIHQMNPRQFVDFIQSFKQHVTAQGSLDLSELTVTEKIDGFALRFAYNHNELYIESSHSGLVTKHSIPTFQNILDYLNEHYKEQIAKLAKSIRTYFKVIGEVLYLENKTFVDPDNSVTFVATKYNEQNLGGFATMVIFDVQGIKKDKIYDLTDDRKEAVITGLRNLSTDDFKFYGINEIKWQDSVPVRFDYNSDAMREVFTDPTFLLDKANKEEFIRIRQVVAQAFSDAISKHGSVMGISGSEVEGIVFTIGNNKVGATNFNWQEVKHKIYRFSDKADEIQKNFFKSIFGYQMRKKIYQCLNEEDALIKYAIPYRLELPKFKNAMAMLIRQFKSATDIPKRVYTGQAYFLLKDNEIIQSLTPNLMDLKRLVSPRTGADITVDDAS